MCPGGLYLFEKADQPFLGIGVSLCYESLLHSSKSLHICTLESFVGLVSGCKCPCALKQHLVHLDPSVCQLECAELVLSGDKTLRGLV